MTGRSIRSPRPIVAALVAAAVAWAPFPALGDVIRLKDGTRYEGDIRRSDDGWVVTLPGGARVVVPANKVAGLEAKPKGGAEAVDSRLASLRRAAEAMPDIRQVIQRYQGFITQYAGTPGVDAAKADLVIWQDRLDRGLVKAGGLWMTPAEHEALREKSFQTAEQALALFQQGRATEAAPLLEQAISENQENPAAWYMKGLLLFKQDKAVEARKAFETASLLVPDHAATHNNLAVVLWRQNQHVAALLSYEKALLAAPLHRGVLDNMAEALSALPEELRQGAPVSRIVRHFNDQDLLLQQQLARSDLYRWGATWVSKADVDKLQAIEREIRATIDRLETEYNAISARLRQVEADLASVQSTLRQMEANSVGTDAYGRVVRYPLPQSYYELVRDVGILKAERDQRVTEQEQMRQQARKVQQAVPTPKYNGVQRLIEWEGTPIFGKAVPAPAVAPFGANGNAPNGDPAAPAAPPVAAPPPPAAEPQVPQVAPATQPAAPTRPKVPHERPSIMDR